MAPEDIESRGPDAMALFFQAIKEGRKYFRRSRLFLTGPARGGKTSLKRALMGQMFNAQEESTIGVECDLHVCVMEKGQKTAWKVRCDDFCCSLDCTEKINLGFPALLITGYTLSLHLLM
jgi:GTPase SAR1 family protein